MACVCPTGYTGVACETGERALGQRWGEAGWGDAGGWVGRVLQQWHLPSRVDSSFPGGSLGHCYLSFLLFPGWLISCSRDLVQILKELISLIGSLLLLYWAETLMDLQPD